MSSNLKTGPLKLFLCDPSSSKETEMGTAQQAPEVTVVMFPDGTVETADNVKSATIPIAVYDALVSSTPASDEGKANTALRAYMDTHGSYLDE